MKCIKAIFDVDLIDGKPSEALTIIKASILCSLWVCIYNPIRAFAIHEESDPEGRYKFINSLDNLGLAIVMLVIYITCKKIKKAKAVIIILHIVRFTYSIGSCEVALLTKKDTGYIIS